MRRRIEAITCDAQHDVGVHPLAPQIEEAIGEPHVLRILGLGIDRERQRLGLRLDFDVGDDELDLAGARLGLTVSAERATTRPVIVTTLSSRSASATGNSGEDTSITHWVTP